MRIFGESSHCAVNPVAMQNRKIRNQSTLQAVPRQLDRPLDQDFKPGL